MIKYVVHPGTVWSKTDGDVHFIGARRLMQLYGVSPLECVIDDVKGTMLGHHTEGLIHLSPDFHGDYKLPKDE